MYGYIKFGFRLLLLMVFFGGGLLAANDVSAQGAEEKLKAAYVANIASFVRWPDEPQKVLLCFSKTSNLYPSLKELDRHVLGNNQFISIKVDPKTLNACHIVYIDQTSGAAFNQQALQAGTQILTISDIPGAIQKGCVIELFVRNLRLRFAINTDVLDTARYHISSKLLRLSRQLD